MYILIPRTTAKKIMKTVRAKKAIDALKWNFKKIFK